MKKSAFFLIKILSKFKNHQTYSYSRCYNFIRIQMKTTSKFSQMFLSHILMAEKKAKRVKQKKMKPSCFDTVGKKKQILMLSINVYLSNFLIQLYIFICIFIIAICSCKYKLCKYKSKADIFVLSTASLITHTKQPIKIDKLERNLLLSRFFIIIIESFRPIK